MTARYCLHYAPDNASLAVRLALETLGLDFDTALVDWRAGALQSSTYRALNPAGLIPVLETPDGPIFETAAILLWLADRHGGLGPAPEAPARGVFLKWLFFTSNTLHADMRLTFYPQKYVGPDPAHQSALRAGVTDRLLGHLDLLETAVAAPDWPGGVTELYLCCLLRWMPLYPESGDRSWFDLTRYPALAAMAARIEATAAAEAAARAEGLGPTPFTAPRPATPQQG